MKRKSFILYTDYYDAVQCLDDGQLGRLFRAVFLHNKGEGEVAVDDDIRVAWEFFRIAMDGNDERYRSVCEKRREVARKRWAGAKESDGMQTDANAYKCIQMDYDNDNDNDNDIKKEEEKKEAVPGATASLPDFPSGDASAALAKSMRAKRDLSAAVAETVAYYNARIAGTGAALVSCTALSDRRRQAIGARIAEHGAERVREMIDRAVASRFLNHEATNAPVNVDWLFRPNNFVKVLDGNYDNHERKNGNGYKTDNTRSGGPLWTPTEDQREHPELYYKTTFRASADEGRNG